MQVKMGTAPAYFENRYRCATALSAGWDGRAAPFPEEQLVYIFARDITDRKAAKAEIAA